MCRSPHACEKRSIYTSDRLSIREVYRLFKCIRFNEESTKFELPSLISALSGTEYFWVMGSTSSAGFETAPQFLQTISGPDSIKILSKHSLQVSFFQTNQYIIKIFIFKAFLQILCQNMFFVPISHNMLELMFLLMVSL